MSIAHPTRVRRQQHRNAAAVLVAGLLALLMVWEAGPARADVVTDTVNVVKATATGEVTGSAAAEVAERVCFGSPCGLIVNGALVAGIVGTATHDVWLPWVQNKIKDLMNSLGGDVPWVLLITNDAPPPMQDFSGSPWFPKITAPADQGVYTIGVFASTATCRTTGGVRYQVVKQPTMNPAAGPYTSDPLMLQGSSGYQQSRSVVAWHTDYTTSPTALDGTTPNPARGRQNGTPETTADPSNLCNAGDALEGAHIDMSHGVGDKTAKRSYDFGSSVDPTKGEYDSQVGCMRADGSTYSVVRHSKASDAPGGAGAVALGHCDPGDIMTGGTISQGGNVLTSWTNPATGYAWDGTPPGLTALSPTAWSASSFNRNLTTPALMLSGLKDGNMSTYWESGQRYNAWISADLGSASSLGQVKIYGGAGDGTAYPNAPTIDGSNDGVNWTTLATTTRGAQLPVGTPRIVDLPGSSWRYLRIDIDMSWSEGGGIGWGWPEVAEVGILGKPNPVQTVNTPYPQCGISSGCTWTVWVDGVQCTPSVVACQSWTQTLQTAPSHVECHYGPYVVAQDLCKWLERSFEPTTTDIPMTGPNTDGDPATYTGPVPSWQPAPTPTTTATVQPQPTGTSTGTSTATVAPQPTDTATSSTATVPAPGGDPQPTDTSTATSTGTSTATGTSTGTSTATSTATVPVGEPCTAGAACPSPPPGSSPDEGECYPNGWGAFNPIEWVLKPTKCALDWAFVPRAEVLTEYSSDIGTKWHASSPGVVIDSVAKIPTGLHADAGNCQGPELDFYNPLSHGDVVMHPFNACSGAMATVRGIVYAALSCGAVIGGAFACKRIVAAAIGMGGA